MLRNDLAAKNSPVRSLACEALGWPRPALGHQPTPPGRGAQAREAYPRAAYVGFRPDGAIRPCLAEAYRNRMAVNVARVDSPLGPWMPHCDLPSTSETPKGRRERGWGPQTLRSTARVSTLAPQQRGGPLNRIGRALELCPDLIQKSLRFCKRHTSHANSPPTQGHRCPTKARDGPGGP